MPETILNINLQNKIIYKEKDRYSTAALRLTVVGSISTRGNDLFSFRHLKTRVTIFTNI